MVETVDLLLTNANEIITVKGPNKPRIIKQMNNLGIIKKGSIAIKNGIIVDVGKNLNYKAKKVINVKGKTVLPGFLDPHTHLVFAGSREFELNMKLKGAKYMDILKKGGGIAYTVKKTRKASMSQLINESKARLDIMLAHGTTTCEGKSGYGLNTESELKILKTMQKLNSSHPMDIIPTFLGAHAVPMEHSTESYVSLVVDEMLSKVSKYAVFCDVFCEKGVFTPSQSMRILKAAKKHGLKLKIHADEIVDTGGAALATKVDTISADHLLMSNKKGLKMMANRGIIGVLLPGTPFSLMMKEYADARNMIDMGIPIALATDLNPNCWVESMQFIIQLGCFNMRMTPAEAITASTFNAACAIDLNDRLGSLEKGKQADLIIMDIPSHLFIPYHFGINLVETVIKKGSIVIN